MNSKAGKSCDDDDDDDDDDDFFFWKTDINVDMVGKNPNNKS